tara:strand:+ start:2053 stop:4104 length:2052 start_codon:yes stop_codon:yes gene_type:complete
MDIRNELALFNFKQKYAAYNHKEKRRESWSEASDRIYEMHKEFYDLSQEADSIIQSAISMEKDKRILSSQRARQFGGKAILDKNWRIYNCTTSYADRPRFFQESLYLLLCGCGVGFSVQKHHIARLPSIRTEDDSYITEKYVIDDNIESWSDALGSLLNFYFGLSDSKPKFDFSLIRPKGSPISAGGKAPGHEPLKKCLENIDNLLSKRLGTRLKSVDVFDIVMHTSNAVLAGGVRRAASIAIFSHDDEDMATAKTGNWYTENPQRARANISAVITPDVNFEEYTNVYKNTKQFGEPGFIFSKSKEFCFNPCVEIGMAPVLIKDEFGDVLETYTLDHLENREFYESEGYTYFSGWQACNLTEVNCSKFESEEDALQAIYGATILGTAQAGYTKSDYLTVVSQKIVERESLIGVSLTGMANSPLLSYNEDFQKEAADVVNKTNRMFAKMLGIPPASRTTCVKPSGNASILLSCASGIHPEYSKKYIRRIQAPATSVIVEFFTQFNPAAVEESIWSAPGTSDKCISFPVEVINDSIYRKDMSALDFIDKVILTQNNWVRSGTQVNRVEGLAHNVSNTILVKDDEWDTVCKKLWDNRNHLSGVSLLSAYGDYDFDQCPFQEIFEVEDIDPKDPKATAKLLMNENWYKLKNSWLPVPYDILKESIDNTTPHQEVACAGGACEMKLGS